MMRIRTLVLASSLLALTSTVSAQYSDQYRRPTPSPELFALEIGVGQYRVSDNEAFDRVFDDHGPHLRLELDFMPFRIPYFGRIGAGFQFGWAKFTAQGCTDATCTNRSDEETRIRIFPLAPVAVLRIDVLARDLGIPLIFAGKIGMDAVIFDAGTGSRDETSGVNIGLRWGAQVALELDFINPQRARVLDDEWGINHTMLFVEIFGSTAANKLKLGTNLSWVAGLGMTF